MKTGQCPRPQAPRNASGGPALAAALAGGPLSGLIDGGA
jgi:hypothetical protein